MKPRRKTTTKQNRWSVFFSSPRVFVLQLGRCCESPLSSGRKTTDAVAVVRRQCISAASAASWQLRRSPSPPPLVAAPSFSSISLARWTAKNSNVGSADQVLTTRQQCRIPDSTSAANVEPRNHFFRHTGFFATTTTTAKCCRASFDVRRHV